MRLAEDEGRVLRCVQCLEDVFVVELPVRFIDPALFRCGRCMVEKPEPAQLALVPDEEPRLRVRQEERRYDPAIAEIPY